MVLLKKGMTGARVKQLQRMLNEALRLSRDEQLAADGDFGPQTLERVKEFQRKAKLKTDGIVGPQTLAALSAKGKIGTKRVAEEMLASSGKRAIQGLGKLKGVKSKLRKKIELFAGKYGAIEITSGLRTVRKQADLMRVMSDQDLNSLYGKNLPYIRKIKAIPAKERSSEKVQRILKEARKQGSYVSRHLSGDAVDISMKGGFDTAKADKIVKELKLRKKLERARNCYHVQL